MLLAQAQAYRQQYGFNAITLIPVNLYGPGDDFDLENAHVIPAVIRKCIEAAERKVPQVALWGTGTPTREFLYVQDAAEGILRASELYDSPEPVNLGSSELVTINQMIGILEDIAGITVEKEHDLTAPQGVRGRNSDNTMFHDVYGWEPSISLRDGLEKTYAWIYDILAKRA